MFEYNENGIAFKVLPELNLFMYARQLSTGDSFRLLSPYNEDGPCWTLPIVPEGSVEFFNEVTPDEKTVLLNEAGKAFKQRLLAGIYTVNCLADDTLYVCLTPHDNALSQIENAKKNDWVFFIDNATLGAGYSENIVLNSQNCYGTVACLYGSVVVHFSESQKDDIILNPSETYSLEEGESVVLSKNPASTTRAEIGWTRLK